MTDRREMQMGDWLNGAAIFAVGMLLGVALDGMVALAGTPFWPMMILIPVLFGGFFLFVLFFDGLICRMFRSRIKPASYPRQKERKPIALLLSLPTGIIIGVIGAQLGLREILV